MANKCIFLAGASGAIGRRLAPLLVASGWRVVGSTRSKDKAPLLREMGVEPVVVDVFDAQALRDAVAGHRPEIVIHQLTDLPFALDASKMAEALVRNARLRDEGTRNLVRPPSTPAPGASSPRASPSSTRRGRCHTARRTRCCRRRTRPTAAR